MAIQRKTTTKRQTAKKTTWSREKNRTQGKKSEPTICPKCGQEMDKLEGIGKVCNECGWTVEA